MPSPTPTASPSPVPGALTPYTGTFTKTADTCAGATANATYGTTNFDPTKPGPTLTVTVTGGDLGGNCFRTFSDGTRQASVNIINSAGNVQPH